MPEGLPGGNGVGQRHPRATVDESARVKMALVHHDPPLAVLVAELQRLDPHVRGEARGDPPLDGVDGDLWGILGHGGG